jgi:spermidine/putrescine transport system substrate-binding protein
MNPLLTRRQLVQRGAAGVTMLSLPNLLAACGGGGEEAATTGTTSGGQELAKSMNFSNWTLYIDVNEKTKSHPTLNAFEKKTGVHVNYFEDINDNDEYFGKIQGPLSRGQSIDRDIIVMTDNSRYPSLLIDKGWVEKLDQAAIPNLKNLVPALRNPSWDPGRVYSLPWQSGMTGIAWNEELTKPVKTVDQLLTDPALKGKITLLSGMGDTLPLVVLSNGDDPSKITDASFDAAIDKLQKAVGSGQIRQFTGNDYSGPLAKGDLHAAVAWSGDVVQLQADNAHLKYDLPTTGGAIWTDNMLIPTGGDVYTASTYMNYVYDPAVAAKIAAYVNYVCPVVGAREVLAKTDPKLAVNPLIFPPQKLLDRVHIMDAKALNNEKYIERWQALIGS